MDKAPARPSAVVLLLVLGAGLLAWTWRNVILLAFAAAVIALALTGFAEFLRRRTPLGPRTSLLAAALIVVASLVATAWLFGAQISDQIEQAANTLPQAWASLQAWLGELPLGARLQGAMERAVSGEALSQFLSGMVGRFGGYAAAMAGAALNLILVVSAAIYFAVDPGPYRRGVLRLAPKELQADVAHALDASGVAIRKWVLGTLISMGIIATLVGVGLWVVGVPAPLALALLAGLSQIVPIIGPLVAAGPGILLAFLAGPETALWAAVIYFAASQLEANFVSPMIQRRAVSIPAALSLFSVIAMGVLFGPMGVLLGIPIALVLMVFVTKFYVQRVLRHDVKLPGENGSGRPSGAHGAGKSHDRVFKRRHQTPA